MMGISVHLLQRLSDIGDEVGAVFQTAGHPHQSRGDAGGDELVAQVNALFCSYVEEQSGIVAETTAPRTDRERNETDFIVGSVGSQDNSEVLHWIAISLGVLAALAREDSYGYKIGKDMSACVSVTESTLYPILRRLESAGSLSVYSVEHNGRLRKIYHITPRGRQQLQDFVADWGEIAAMYEFIKGGLEHEQV